MPPHISSYGCACDSCVVPPAVSPSSTDKLNTLAKQVKDEFAQQQQRTKDAEEKIGAPQAKRILKYALKEPGLVWKVSSNSRPGTPYIDLPGNLSCESGCQELLKKRGFEFFRSSLFYSSAAKQ